MVVHDDWQRWIDRELGGLEVLDFKLVGFETLRASLSTASYLRYPSEGKCTLTLFLNNDGLLTQASLWVISTVDATHYSNFVTGPDSNRPMWIHRNGDPPEVLDDTTHLRVIVDVCGL